MWVILESISISSSYSSVINSISEIMKYACITLEHSIATSNEMGIKVLFKQMFDRNVTTN
jgi:hypothetical protein